MLISIRYPSVGYMVGSITVGVAITSGTWRSWEASFTTTWRCKVSSRQPLKEGPRDVPDDLLAHCREPAQVLTGRQPCGMQFEMIAMNNSLLRIEYQLRGAGGVGSEDWC